MLVSVVFFAGIAGATRNYRDCADDDTSLKSAFADSSNWAHWSCTEAAHDGYCNYRTESMKVIGTHCRASCGLCDGGKASIRTKVSQGRRLYASTKSASSSNLLVIFGEISKFSRNLF
eukprot:GEMP01091162.1.p1 GENE.GEMP01091162.1~~GEMP01091162.1.p1  ORF type:complete len:118 (+),score=8.61 GEMP01091162.1:58-411(+)